MLTQQGATPFHVWIAEPVTLRDLFADWHPSPSLINLLGLVGVVLFIYFLAWLLNRPRTVRMGEDEMTRHFRNARVRFIVGEGITDFVEDAVFKDKLTRAESIDIYTKIGRAFSLVDLLPKRPLRKKLSRGETEHLKEQIKARIKQQTVTPTLVVTHKKRVLGKGYM